MIADGPAELPQLGWSVRIRNVPAGQCTYACVYCWLGGTIRLRVRRRPFHATEEVVAAARGRLPGNLPGGPPPYYLTFVHGGEPTLDSHLGAELSRLSRIGLPLAVMTNASLLWRPEVRAALLPADRVLIKVDTVDARVWRRLNRPAPQLRLPRVLSGIEAFRAQYGGKLETQTALVPGLNDAPAEIETLAAFLARLAPARSYLSWQAASGSTASQGTSAEVANALERLTALVPRLTPLGALPHDRDEDEL